MLWNRASQKARRLSIRECLVERCQNINVMRSTRNKLPLPVFVSVPILCVVRSFRNPPSDGKSKELGKRQKADDGVSSREFIETPQSLSLQHCYDYLVDEGGERDLLALIFRTCSINLEIIFLVLPATQRTVSRESPVYNYAPKRYFVSVCI